MKELRGGTVTSIDFAERWMRDGLRVVEPAGGMCSRSIDMTACQAVRERLKLQGQAVTLAPVIVSAAAKALARHPSLQKLTAGNRKLSGGNIDICLSVAGEGALTPVVIIEQADRKTALQIQQEIAEKLPIAQKEADHLLRMLRNWGWLVPFGFARRRLLRYLLNQLWYRRQVSGLFQVTILPGLDGVAAQLFNTAGALAVGGLAERPAVIGGLVRPQLNAPFTCTIDHKQWNGSNAALFLQELDKLLSLESEILFVQPPAAKSVSA